eukprot:gene432-547_t
MVVILVNSENCEFTPRIQIIPTGSSCIPAVSRCEYGSFCHQHDGSASCVPYVVNEGEPCDPFFGLGMKKCLPELLRCNSSKVCAVKPYLGVGDNCTKNQECRLKLQCIEGKCQVGEGDHCDKKFDFTCPFGETCGERYDQEKNVTIYECVPKIKEWGSCTEDRQCVDFMICTYMPKNMDKNDKSKFCQKINSKSEGDRCLRTDRYYLPVDAPVPDCDVSQGLVCSGEEFCVKFDSVLAPSTFNCNKTNGICHHFYNEQCVCNTGPQAGGSCKTGFSITPECKQYIDKVVQCAITNKCQIFRTEPFIFENSKTCIYKNCGEHLCSSPDMCLTPGYFRELKKLRNHYLCKGIYPMEPSSDASPTVINTSDPPSTSSSTDPNDSNTLLPSTSIIHSFLIILLLTVLLISTVALSSATDCPIYTCAACCDNLNNKIIDLENRVTILENSKVRTQVVVTPNQVNSVSSTLWTAIPGTNQVVTITRPSKLVAYVHTVSHADPASSGAETVDVTGFLNGNLMALGNLGSSAPSGLGITHTREFTNAIAINEETLNPGTYIFDIRARVRTPSANPAAVNNPAALLWIVPL